MVPAIGPIMDEHKKKKGNNIVSYFFLFFPLYNWMLRSSHSRKKWGMSQSAAFVLLGIYKVNEIARVRERY